MTLQTSPEEPAPLRQIARILNDYIGRLGSIWVEGQIAQLRRRPGAQQYLTLRDTDEQFSVSVVISAAALDAVTPAIEEGQRVVVFAKPEYWASQGTLHLRAREIRPVGVGTLLEQLERLKQLLTAEGLFSSDRKKPLPFLPRRIGLICGRAAAAKDDVLVNSRLRWPGVSFEVREVAVQGVACVAEVTEALTELDALADIDVIVIARGGGSFEDLLPFSNEALIRAVSKCRTPVVSAIGHEQDGPLLDLVADLRESTPTDAAKRIVPDVGEELRAIAQLQQRGHRVVSNRVEQDTRFVDEGRRRIRSTITSRVQHGLVEIDQLSARVRALSPAATLDRGYAVVQYANSVVRDPQEVPVDGELRIRVAHGELSATRTKDGS
jgi:exodeoxyribonuclease VII large subunit